MAYFVFLPKIVKAFIEALSYHLRRLWLRGFFIIRISYFHYQSFHAKRFFFGLYFISFHEVILGKDGLTSIFFSILKQAISVLNDNRLFLIHYLEIFPIFSWGMLVKTGWSAYLDGLFIIIVTFSCTFLYLFQRRRMIRNKYMIILIFRLSNSFPMTRYIFFLIN